jgi:hypothetical protein
VGDRIKGILIMFGYYTKLTGVTNTWKARAGILNYLNKLYKPHFKSREQIQGYILREKANYIVSTDMTRKGL